MTIDNADLQFLSSNGRLNQPSSNDNSSMVEDKTGKKQCKLWRNLHNNYLWCIFNTKLVLSAEASCKCKNLVNQQGYGNCKFKSYASQSFREFCYVDQPSNCSDLISSKSIVGEQFSSEACNLKGKLYMNIIVIELRIIPKTFRTSLDYFLFSFFRNTMLFA